MCSYCNGSINVWLLEDAQKCIKSIGTKIPIKGENIDEAYWNE